MAELKKLVLKRKCLRISSTKKSSKLDLYLQSSNLEKAKIEALIQIIQELQNQLLQLDTEIQELLMDDEDAYIAEVDESQERGENLVICVCRAKEVLRTLEQDAQSERGSGPQSEHSFCTGNHKSAGVKLPTIVLPTFEADPLTWSTFWDVFKSAVHEREDVSKAQRFSYLRGQLKGEAKQLLAGFPTADAFYDEAVELLKKTYGKPYTIIRAHIHSLLDLASPKANAKDLRAFMAQYECHLRALTALDVKVEDASFLFTAILLRKLPTRVHDNINRAAVGDTWTLEAFRSAIEREIELMGNLLTESRSDIPTSGSVSKSPNRPSVRPKGKKPDSLNKTATGNFHVGSNKGQCLFCDGNHNYQLCKTVKDPRQRYEAVRSKGLCPNCLLMHPSLPCPSENRCFRCQKTHHAYLCFSQGLKDKPSSKGKTLPSRKGYNKPTEERKLKTDLEVTIPQDRQPSSPSSPTVSTLASLSAALPTAMMPIKSPNGLVFVRALFDQGAQRSFISSDKAAELGFEVLRYEGISLSVLGRAGTPTQYPVVKVPVSFRNRTVNLELLVVDILPTDISTPGLVSTVRRLKKKRVPLADPQITSDQISVSMLIGADLYHFFVEGSSYLYGMNLIHTPMGKMLSGPLPRDTRRGTVSTTHVAAYKCGVEFWDEVTKLWELETIGISRYELKVDDAKIYESFDQLIDFRDGQYCSQLPWKENRPTLPDGFGLAAGRLNSTLKQLAKKTGQLDAYNSVFKEHEAKGFIEEVVDPLVKSDGVIHYLPHLPVWRSDSATTPLRVVFDCSAGSPSLNDCLVTGPSLNHDLVKVLLRFRLQRYACVSDISKAYLMIGLHPKDRDATRFLWPRNPENPQGPTKVYRFKVILFGATCSQFILNATVQHHLKTFESTTARALERNIYVDNIQFTTDDPLTLYNFYREAKASWAKPIYICESGQVTLRKRKLNILITAMAVKSQTKSKKSWA